jgi:hypothetical protein
MKQPTPRELMQVALTCVVLSAGMFHWSPELSYYLGALATALMCVAAMPATNQSTNATRVNITDGVPGPAVRSYLAIGPAVAVNGV